MKNLLTGLAAIVIMAFTVMALVHCVVTEERIAAAKTEKLRAERNEIVNVWRVSR